MFDMTTNDEALLWAGLIILLGFAFILIVRMVKKYTSVEDTGKAGVKSLDGFIQNQKEQVCKQKQTAILRDIAIDSDHTWQNASIGEFFKTHMLPCKQGLVFRDVFKSLIQLLDILDKYGVCSSIVQNDIESLQWKRNTLSAKGYGVLSRITLIAHSLGVVKILIKDQKKDNVDYREIMGNLMITGLGHDLGKIPKFHTKPYDKVDHPYISHEILAGILPDSLKSKNMILTAVRDHHFPADGSNPLTVMLKAADHKARVQELQEHAGDLAAIFKATGQGQKIQPKGMPAGKHKGIKHTPVNLDWLDPKELLDRLAEYVNVIDDSKYRAFSFNGLVYIQPELIYDVVTRAGIEKNNFSLLAFGAETRQKNQVVYAVRTLLHDHVPSQIGKDFIGQKYRITTWEGKTLSPGFYLPVKVSAFDIPPSRFEDRKKGTTYSHLLLQSIKYVEVVPRKSA